jgi:hypothetical protein
MEEITGQKEDRGQEGPGHATAMGGNVLFSNEKESGGEEGGA